MVELFGLVVVVCVQDKLDFPLYVANDALGGKFFSL